MKIGNDEIGERPSVPLECGVIKQLILKELTRLDNITEGLKKEQQFEAIHDVGQQRIGICGLWIELQQNGIAL